MGQLLSQANMLHELPVTLISLNICAYLDIGCYKSKGDSYFLSNHLCFFKKKLISYLFFAKREQKKEFHKGKLKIYPVFEFILKLLQEY